MKNHLKRDKVLADWTAGYIANIDYTYGYYQELNPLRAQLALLNQGLVYPEVKTACELGYGQGLAINLHAATSSTRWYGTDFNPTQASFAQELAIVSGAPVSLYSDSFSEFCLRDELPGFDFISLHGVWSWISDENRQVIVDFISKKLNVGGLLYISYNTLPGWASFAPIRHLMSLHTERMGAQGSGIVNRIDDAVDFAKNLLDKKPEYSLANPLVSQRLEHLSTQNRHYLAHEYFNRDWEPMHFASVADWLESAKISYACSAHYLDDFESINVSPQQQEFLKSIPDKKLRESTKDFMTNQVFRRDYWVKGPRKLSKLEQQESFRALRIASLKPRSDMGLTLKDGNRKINLNKDIYNPILDLLADHAHISLGELERELHSQNVSLSQIVQAVMLLSDCGHVSGVCELNADAPTREKADALNSFLLKRSRSSGDIIYLASPATAGGVNLNRPSQLFLSAYRSGEKNPEGLARNVWQVLFEQGERLVEDGKTLETEAENIAALSKQASLFLTERLPILKSLQIV